jgi:hypothetical protein
MMRGHYAYYGIGGNGRRLRWFARQVVRVEEPNAGNLLVRDCEEWGW